jgi:transposase
MTVVVDHDSGRLVWAAPGRDTATLRRVFDALGAERAAQITHVSADAADWIADVVTERCPGAIRCADPFYGEFRIMPMWGGLRLVTAVTTPVISA